MSTHNGRQMPAQIDRTPGHGVNTKEVNRACDAYFKRRRRRAAKGAK